MSHIVILRRSADSLLRMSHQHFLEVYMRRPPEELLAINPYLNVAWQVVVIPVWQYLLLCIEIVIVIVIVNVFSCVNFQNLFEGVFTLAEEVSALGMTLHSIRNIEALVSV